MKRFASVVIRFRLALLLAAAMVTVVLAAQVPSLQQDDDVLRFLPAEDPDIRLFRRVSAEFGGLDVAIVGVESPDLLSIDGLTTIRRMTQAAAAVQGVYHTLAVTDVPHLDTAGDTFSITPLVPEELRPEEIEQVRRLVLTDPLAKGRLVSVDGQAAMVLCFLSAQSNRTAVVNELRRVVAAEAGDVQVYFGGLPFVQSHIAGGTRRDMVRLTPYVLLLAALSTFIFFRRPAGALLVLSAVALGTIWVIGGMAAAGAPMTLVSTSLPVVLVAIGGAYGAHVLAAFYTAQAPTPALRVVVALQEVGPPVAISVLTTIAGFLSFLAMDVVPMRTFGLQAAAGVMCCGLVALVVIPAVLSFSRSKARRAPAERLAPPISRWALAVRARRWTTVGSLLALALLAAATTWRVVPDTSLESFFRPGSEPAEAERFLRDRFGGSTFVQVYFRGDLSDPVVLDEVRKVVEQARTISGVSDVTSFLETLEMLAAGFGGLRRLPQTPEQVAGLGPFMAGNPALRQLVDDELTRAMIQITVSSQDTRVVRAVVDGLKRFVDEEIPRQLLAVDLRQEGSHRIAARERRLLQIARRIDRLLRIAGHEPAREATSRINDLLQQEFGQWTLEAGVDLDRAVNEAVHQFFHSDDSPFDPFDTTTLAQALVPVAQRPVVAGSLESVLARSLPAELASDSDGVEMAAPALADRLSGARAHVVATRLLPQVMTAAGLPDVAAKERLNVRLALAELDDWRVGLPDAGGVALDVGVTGTPVINEAFGRSTQRNQVRSVLISLVLLLFLASLVFRSPVFGWLAVLPAGMTLLITFGLMGWWGIPLDPGSCMVAALSLGIGIDYAIHYVWRRRWRGQGLAETATSVGPAILFNAVQVASGFAVMIVADTVPLSRFGALVTVAMLVAAAMTFTLLPALDRERVSS
jgi:predicted RND superfamily exporter protein